MSAAKAGIIVLNWNGLADTRACVRSLLELRGTPATLYVVDNGSEDGSAEALHREFADQIVLIANPRNLLYAGGNNVGILRALDDGCDELLLLNNDTVVDPHMLEELRAARAAHGDAVYCPKILYFDRPDRYWYAGGKINLNRARWSHRGIREPDRGQYGVIEETGWATGCALFSTDKVIEKVGLLDDSFRLYQEDVDWCLRAKSAGYKIWYVPKAVVRHKVSASLGGNLSRAKLTRKWRSLRQLMRKHVPNPVRRYFALTDYCITEATRAIWARLTGRLQ